MICFSKKLVILLFFCAAFYLSFNYFFGQVSFAQTGWEGWMEHLDLEYDPSIDALVREGDFGIPTTYYFFSEEAYLDFYSHCNCTSATDIEYSFIGEPFYFYAFTPVYQDPIVPEMGNYFEPGVFEQISETAIGGGRIDGRAWVDRNGNGVFEAEGPYEVCDYSEYGTCEAFYRSASEADYYLNGAKVTLKGYANPVWQGNVFLTATATTSAITQPAPRPTSTPTPCPTPAAATGPCVPPSPTATPIPPFEGDIGVFDWRAKFPFFSFLNNILIPQKAFAQLQSVGRGTGGDTGGGWKWNGPGWYLFPGLPADLINPIKYDVSITPPRGYKVSTPRTKTVYLGSCIAPGGCPTIEIYTQTDGRKVYRTVGINPITGEPTGTYGPINLKLSINLPGGLWPYPHHPCNSRGVCV
jgi:hypothetical protein